MKVAKDEKDTDLKLVDIRDYAIKWHDKIKDKYVFSLNIIQGKKYKYKSFIFGSKDEKEAREWYNVFRSIQVHIIYNIHILDWCISNPRR